MTVNRILLLLENPANRHLLCQWLGERYEVIICDPPNERDEAIERLRASEARYRLLAENASDIIFTLDMDLRFIYISPAVTRIRGFTVEEAMAQTPAEALTPASLRTF